MEWKQPIPTNIDETCKGDEFAATIFEKLLLKSANSKRVIYIEGVPIQIQKGDCIFSQIKWAKYFGLKKSEHRRVSRKIVKLEKTYKLITKRKSINCTVVTILNYDKYIEMTNQTTYQRRNGDRTMTTYKNNKNKTITNEFIKNQEVRQALSLVGIKYE